MNHSVLQVRFGADAPVCHDRNNEPLDPEVAQQRLLYQTLSWAALLCCGPDPQPLLRWTARLRSAPQGHIPVLVTLLPDPGSPAGIAALQAGVDALLPGDSPAPLIRAQLQQLRRRLTGLQRPAMQLVDGVRLDADHRRVTCGERSVTLSPKLFALLWHLAQRPGEVATVQSLRLAMDIPARAADDAVHTAARRLRSALRPLGLHDRVQTVWGAGYVWLTPTAEAALATTMTEDTQLYTFSPG